MITHCPLSAHNVIEQAIHMHRCTDILVELFLYKMIIWPQERKIVWRTEVNGSRFLRRSTQTITGLSFASVYAQISARVEGKVCVYVNAAVCRHLCSRLHQSCSRSLRRPTARLVRMFAERTIPLTKG